LDGLDGDGWMDGWIPHVNKREKKREKRDEEMKFFISIYTWCKQKDQPSVVQERL